jgi:hypothetical protein
MSESRLICVSTRGSGTALNVHDGCPARAGVQPVPAFPAGGSPFGRDIVSRLRAAAGGGPEWLARSGGATNRSTFSRMMSVDLSRRLAQVTSRYVGGYDAVVSAYGDWCVRHRNGCAASVQVNDSSVPTFGEDMNLEQGRGLGICIRSARDGTMSSSCLAPHDVRGFMTRASVHAAPATRRPRLRHHAAAGCASAVPATSASKGGMA